MSFLTSPTLRLISNLIVAGGFMHVGMYLVLKRDIWSLSFAQGIALISVAVYSTISAIAFFVVYMEWCVSRFCYSDIYALANWIQTLAAIWLLAHVFGVVDKIKNRIS